MDFLQNCMIGLVFLSFLLLMYKIYLQGKLDNPDRKGSWTTLLIITFSIKYLTPVFRNNYHISDASIIKRANLSLKYCWLTFGMAVMLAFIKEFLH